MRFKVIFLRILALFLIIAMQGAEMKVVEKTVAMVTELDIVRAKRDMEPLPHFLPIEVRSWDGVKDKKSTNLLSVTLRLQKRSDIRPSDVKVTFENENLRDQRYKSLGNVGFYHDPVTQAVISVTTDWDKSSYKRTLLGTFVHNDKAYEITPVSHEKDNIETLISEKGLDTEELHRVHVLRQVIMPTSQAEVNYDSKLARDLQNLDSEDILEILNHRIHKNLVDDEPVAMDTSEAEKRMVSMKQNSYHVELIFLLDYSVYKYWLDKHQGDHIKAVYDLTMFFTHIYHGMYMAYSSIPFEKYKISITPWLKEIIVTTTASEAWFSEQAKISQSRIKLDISEENIRSYMEQKGFTWSHPDHLMLWSRYNLDLGGNSVLGLASSICSVCKKGQGLSQAHEYGFFSWATGSHEMAHTLGAMHDKTSFGCSPADNYLMTPASMELQHPTYKNSFTFSKCSVDMMKRCFKGISYGGIYPSFPRSCVYDTICRHGQPIQESLQELPGQKYSLTEQCKLSIGKSTAWYDKSCTTGSSGLCMKMMCRDGSQCTNNGNPELRAALGTPCEKNKPNMICHQGDCIDSSAITYGQTGSNSACSIVRRIPISCKDNESYKSNEGMTCSEIVQRFPWKCFHSKEVQKNCKSSCFKWGLIRIAKPLCNYHQVIIDVQSVTPSNTNVDKNGYVNKLKFTYCGYQQGSWFVQCPNLPTRCIPMRYVCDGHDDCPLGADEERSFCFKVPSGVNDTNSVMVRCPGEPNTLIPDAWLCNGHPDCPGGRDEEPAKCDPFKYCNNKGTEVTCPNDPRMCVPVAYTCDGFEDCGIGAQAGDENKQFCETLCPPGKIRCPNIQSGFQCIRGSWACDGSNDCGNNEDENQVWCQSLKNMTAITCPQGEKNCPDALYICLAEDAFCDGREDCPKGGDELKCPTATIKVRTSMDKLHRVIRLLKQRQQQRKHQRLLKIQEMNSRAKKTFSRKSGHMKS